MGPMLKSMISTAISPIGGKLNKCLGSVIHSTNCTAWSTESRSFWKEGTLSSVCASKSCCHSIEISILSWKPHQGAHTVEESKWPSSQKR